MTDHADESEVVRLKRFLEELGADPVAAAWAVNNKQAALRILEEELERRRRAARGRDEAAP
jgi:hypothetical protein